MTISGKSFMFSLALAGALVSNASGQPAVAEYPVSPVPLSQVKLTDGFWKPRIEINARVTVPACFKK